MLNDLGKWGLNENQMSKYINGPHRNEHALLSQVKVCDTIDTLNYLWWHPWKLPPHSMTYCTPAPKVTLEPSMIHTSLIHIRSSLLLSWTWYIHTSLIHIMQELTLEPNIIHTSIRITRGVHCMGVGGDRVPCLVYPKYHPSKVHLCLCFQLYIERQFQFVIL